MALRTRGLVASMEDIDNVVVDDISEDEVKLAEGHNEVLENTDAVNDLADDIDDTVEDADTLSNYADAMEEKIEQGEGISEDAAEIAEIAIESIYNRLGIKHEGKVLPSMESFGSTNTRLAATKISLEGINDKLASIWKAIKNALIEMWKKVKEFFMKFFDNTDRVIKVAKKYKEEVKKLSKAEMKDKELDNKSLANSFSVNGKADLATCVQILDNHTTMANGVNKAKDTLIKVADKLQLVATRKQSLKDSKVGEDFIEVSKQISGTASKVSTSNTDGKTNHTVTIGPLVKDSSFEIAVSIDDESKAATMSSGTIARTSKVVDKVTTLTTAQMVEVLDKVIVTANATGEYKKNLAKFEELNKAIIKTADAALVTVSKIESLSSKETDEDKEKSKEFKKALDGNRKLLTSLSSNVSRFMTLIPSLNVSACNAALGYVKASMKAYEVKEA